MLPALNSCLQGPKGTGLTPVSWSSELIDSFEKCRESIAQGVLLAHLDINAKWAIFADASDFAVGAVLQQLVQGHWQPLNFFSWKLGNRHQKLCPYDRELHGVYEAVRHFCHNFEGRHNNFYWTQAFNPCFPTESRSSFTMAISSSRSNWTVHNRHTSYLWGDTVVADRFMTLHILG